jgi:glycosyltransferase involved in cell wall biosynthesis
MKIIHLMTYPLSDVEEYIDEIPKHNLFGYATFKKLGIDVTWFSPNREHKVLKFFSKLFGDEVFKIALQFRAVYESRNYDLIYSAHDIHILFLALMRWIGICRKPVVMLCHFSYNMNFVSNKKVRFLKRLERWVVYNGVDKVIFANENLLNMAIKDYNVPVKHRNFANWGADLDFFDSFRMEGTYPSDDFYVAAGTANRDYDTLVKAFLRMNFKLKVFGRLGESIDLNANQKNNIEFYNLSKEGPNGMVILQDYYYNSIAVLLPIQRSNDVPNGASVLIEALAVGKPIIITDLESNYIDVERENVGLKVKLHDIDGWIKAIEYLEANKKIAEQMGSNSKKLAIETYNYNFFTESILKSIDLVLENRK